jgi:hypothetical protein
LREAVRRGEVSARKAEIVAPIALGEDEARWVERAKADTVRALKAAVTSARPAESTMGEGGASLAMKPDAEDEAWDRVYVQLTPEGRAKLDEAMASRKILGETSPKWKRLEAIREEFRVLTRQKCARARVRSCGRPATSGSRRRRRRSRRR